MERLFDDAFCMVMACHKAKEAGKPLYVFDKKKIKQLMELHDVRQANICLAGDECVNYAIVWLADGRVEAGECHFGSLWATPTLILPDESRYDVGIENSDDVDLEWIGKISYDEEEAHVNR